MPGFAGEVCWYGEKWPTDRQIARRRLSGLRRLPGLLCGGFCSRFAQEQRESDSDNNRHDPEVGSFFEVRKMVTA
jgi:hypothetical protein